jgi:glycine/D-amino acid oxidase-like deaminating enzyme
VIVGAGLAGSLLALALARRGLATTLVGPALVGPALGVPGPVASPDLWESQPAPAATAISYGSLLGRAAARSWQELERQHGPLGWQPAPLLLHGWPAPLGLLPVSVQGLATAALAFSRVDTVALAAALPAALAAAGVERCEAMVESIAAGAGGWRLSLTSGEELQAPQLVLAAGASSRSLWPLLPERLRFSWAGVVVGEGDGAAVPGSPVTTTAKGLPPWLRHARRGGIVQPQGWQRPGLEARSAQLVGEEWIVDAGLAPWGQRVLLGQISLVGPDLDPRRPPDPAGMEQRLREGLGALDPRLAGMAGPYRQVAVAYCTNGQPLVGAVADQPGLWLFTGFAGAFSTVPGLAERLATKLQAALS